MMKRNVILLALLCILAMAVLAAPVSAGLDIVDGVKITATDGATSPVITITESDIAQDGTITIYVGDLNYYVSGYSLTNDNVVITSDAVAATWTGDVAGDTLTLTSTNNDTVAGDSVTVTFTGAVIPWVSDADTAFSMSVTRTDGKGDAFINFEILIAPPAPHGLSIVDGAKITATDGATSPVITITESDFAQDGTITIDVSSLHACVVGGITDANVEITSDAVAAIWTGDVAGDTLTLTSTNNDTVAGDSVTVTFTGTANPWIYTGGDWGFPLTATRTDGLGFGYFNFDIYTTPPPPVDLIIADGAKITATNGATSPVITITGDPIDEDGTITIDVSSLNAYVSSGTLTDANVVVHDSAAAATWTRAVAGSTLTLTSTNNDTVAGDSVTVTFTGAGGNPWIPDMLRDRTIDLTATRMDNFGTGTFVIKTAPPPRFTVAANFVASPTSDMAPLDVTFTDTSAGHPDVWSWDFGDGTTSTDQNPPIHTYAIGTYTVSLTATNVYTSDTITKYQYIKALNGAVLTADTAINGLTINNCEGPQTVTVDTSILPAALIPPTNSVLEIQPLAGTGFKTIIIYAQNGFSQNGNLITGHPTGVHLVSEEIHPDPSFFNKIGTKSSFNYSIDLPSYPCNAILSTKILEGVVPEYDAKLQKIAFGNGAASIGTAYTAKITKTNFPSAAPVKLHMSVNSSWNDDLDGGPGNVFIWRISDDGTQGQIFPTTKLNTVPVDNLNYYEADSPLGMSTFGISSLTGSNNPFQMIGLVAAAIINEEHPSNPDNPTTPPTNTTITNATITPTQTPRTSPPPPNPGKTEQLYSNANGVITQPTTLQSLDDLATVTVGTGVVANGVDGKPLSSITITAIPAENLPGTPPGSAFSFAGRAYDLQPDGATFAPEISIRFTAPTVQFGQEFIVKTYDRATGTWHDAPTKYNPNDGTITAQISHFCYVALFTKTVTAQPTITATHAPTKAAAIAASSSVNNFVGMITWVVETILGNPIIIIGIIILAVAIVLYGWKRRRDHLMRFR